jgi:hypothetical protein
MDQFERCRNHGGSDHFLRLISVAGHQVALVGDVPRRILEGRLRFGGSEGWCYCVFVAAVSVTEERYFGRSKYIVVECHHDGIEIVCQIRGEVFVGSG